MCRRWIVILPESYYTTWIPEVKGKFYVVVAIAQAACEKTQKYVILPRSVFERCEDSTFSLVVLRTADPSPANDAVRDDKSDSFRSLLGF
jgi:hypothetical protein